MDLRNRILVWAERCLGSFIVKNIRSDSVLCELAPTFDDLKNLVQNHDDAHLVILDSDEIEQSLQNACAKLFAIRSSIEIWVISPSDSPGKSRASTRDLDFSDVFRKKFSGRLRARQRDGVADELSAYLAALRQRAAASNQRTLKYIVPVIDHRKSPDEAAPPNELASSISAQLAEFSGSIHLSDSMLRECYVQMLEDPDSGLSSSLTEETKKRWENYAIALAADVSRDHATEVGPDLDACAHFGQVLFARNRYTYMVLGDRGCGKTTFTSFFFSTYIPRAFPEETVFAFHVDFLRYDFVSDAQTLAFAVQKYLFGALKRPHMRSEERVPKHASFNDFVDSRDYDALALLSGPYPEGLSTDDIPQCRDYLESLLSALGHEDLQHVYQVVEQKEQAPEAFTDLLTWRNQFRVNADLPRVCRLVKHFCGKSRRNREDVITETIVNSAYQREELREFLRDAGIDPGAGPLPKSSELTKRVKSFLTRLSKDGHVYVVIDNADRSIFPQVELAIFRTVWNFLPRGTEGTARPQIVFCMRTDTFHRHQDSFYAQELTDDVREVANVFCGTVLTAPDFVKIAEARLHFIKKELTGPGDSETREALETYVDSVLQSPTTCGLFRALFGGDHRRNLELFELALASPHIVCTDAYYFAKHHFKGGAPRSDAKDYVKRHRLLTSLMLGPWPTFKQRRSLVFLNVYNAQLELEKQEMWRNALAIPRLLNIIESHPDHVAPFEEARDTMLGILDYSAEQLYRIVSLLCQYHLIRCTDAGGRHCTPLNLKSVARLTLTDRGHYYVGDGDAEPGLIYRLEYLQAVYWDTPMPSQFYYPEFDTVMELRHLESFVLSFEGLLAHAESRELAAVERGERSIPDSLPWLSTQVREVAMEQVNSIYLSRK